MLAFEAREMLHREFERKHFAQPGTLLYLRKAICARYYVSRILNSGTEATDPRHYNAVVSETYFSSSVRSQSSAKILIVTLQRCIHGLTPVGTSGTVVQMQLQAAAVLARLYQDAHLVLGLAVNRRDASWTCLEVRGLPFGSNRVGINK